MTIGQIACRCGATSKSFEETSSVGDRHQRSGFQPILLGGGGIAWICQQCWKKLHVVSDLLKEIFGEDARNVYIGSLPNILQKDAG